MKMNVTLPALKSRINRKLKLDDQKLVKTSPLQVSSYGEYHIVDTYKNIIVAYPVEIESLARELKCLAGYEQLGP